MSGHGAGVESQPHVLDIGGLTAALDSFARQTEATAGVDGAVVLGQARALLAQLRAAPIAATDPGGPEQSVGAGGWQAVAVRDGPGDEDITCWRDGGEAQTSIHGTWVGERLELVDVQVGEHVWGMRETPTGESIFSTDESLEGAADRRSFEEISRKAREERIRWGQEKAADEWVCERCSWRNKGSEARCAFCGIPGDPWSGETHTAGAEGLDDWGPVDDTHELALPEGYEGGLPELFAELTFKAVDLVRGSADREPAADVTYGDIVLDDFDPDRKEEVIQAVMDARELTGESPADMSHAEELLESPPAIVCAGISAARAALIQRSLEQAGAWTVFRRRDG